MSISTPRRLGSQAEGDRFMDVRVSQINGIDIYQIVEIGIGPEVQLIFEDSQLQELPRIPWLYPTYVDESGNINAISQCFLFSIANRVIVVDTCLGNGKERSDLPQWGNLQTDFLSAFSSTGFDPDHVTDVLCTHMHADHVGWNTKLIDGVWMPTFRRARHYFSRAEYEYMTTPDSTATADNLRAYDDSVKPIIEAGLAVFVETDAELGDGISLVPTPGHTIGHVSVCIAANGGELFITGDAVHHPCQIARAHWSTLIDYDRAQAEASRRHLLSRASGPSAFLAGTHFALPSIGRIFACTDGDYEFRPDCCARIIGG